MGVRSQPSSLEAAPRPRPFPPFPASPNPPPLKSCSPWTLPELSKAFSHLFFKPGDNNGACLPAPGLNEIMRRKHSAQVPGMENALPLLALTILLPEPRWGISQSHHLRPHCHLPLRRLGWEALLCPARFLLGLADQLANRTALPECSGGSPRGPGGVCGGEAFQKLSHAGGHVLPGLFAGEIDKYNREFDFSFLTFSGDLCMPTLGNGMKCTFKATACTAAGRASRGGPSLLCNYCRERHTRSFNKGRAVSI